MSKSNYSTRSNTAAINKQIVANEESKTKSTTTKNILESLKTTIPDATNLAPKKKPASQKSKLTKVENQIPRGLAKSGRPWKEPKKKFATIKKSLHRRTFEKKMEFRNDIKHIKEVSRSIKEAKKQSNELKKQRRLANAEKRLENERKSEVVQIIKNPAKLKRLRRKQLRQIEKRDLDKLKVV